MNIAKRRICKSIDAQRKLHPNIMRGNGRGASNLLVVFLTITSFLPWTTVSMTMQLPKHQNASPVVLPVVIQEIQPRRNSSSPKNCNDAENNNQSNNKDNVIPFLPFCPDEYTTTATTKITTANSVRRRTFLRDMAATTNILTASSMVISSGSIISLFPSISSAASISFIITFNEANDILTSQRIACDDIVIVTQRGDLGEAAFKVQQLNSQVSMAGKVVLERLLVLQNQNKKDTASSSSQQQQQNASTRTATISLVRLLQCQESFAILEESISDCSLQFTKALQGKLGTTAPAQMKLLVKLQNVMSSYDDFLTLLHTTTITTHIVEKEIK